VDERCGINDPAPTARDAERDGQRYEAEAQEDEAA
jgi:hypothetical protein